MQKDTKSTLHISTVFPTEVCACNRLKLAGTGCTFCRKERTKVTGVTGVQGA